MEKPRMNRREFVGATLGAAAGVLGSGEVRNARAGAPGRTAAPPAGRSLGRLRTLSTPSAGGGPKVGLYSITFLGIWYRGAALSLEELIKRARRYGYDGIEIDGKRPHGNPADLPKARCRELRAMAEGEGVEIFGVAANNDFSSPITEQRECQILYVRELIRVASDLGAKTVRVFLAWPGVTQHSRLASYDIARPLWQTVHRGIPPEQVWDWCRDGLAECARVAGEAGVALALQNHKPVINTHHDVVRMVREVNSPHLKVSLDAPIMPVKSPEYMRQAALDVGPLQALSHFGGEYDRGSDGKVKGESYYGPFLRAMKEIGYRGYMSYELCHPLPKINAQTVGIEYAEKNAQLAAEFMRGVISSVAVE